jgi:hypothetical protein
MEKSFAQKKNSLEEKIPEFRSTLDVLALLQAKKVSLGLQYPWRCGEETTRV